MIKNFKNQNVIRKCANEIIDCFENFNISITVTLKLRFTSFVVSMDPIYPAPPVIKTFFINYKNFEFLSLILKIGLLLGHLILIFGSFHLKLIWLFASIYFPL